MQERYFQGFCIKEDTLDEKNFLTESNELVGAVDLFINGKKEITINYFAHFMGREHITEKDIWDYISNNCKRHTKGKTIYISQTFVDNVHSDPLVNIFN